jgi:3-deoxy-7-phosphoheptulonate synthase
MSAMDSPRHEIDRLDRQILSLLARRMEAVRQVSRLKESAGGQAVRDDVREQEVAEAWSRTATENGLSEYFAGRVLAEVLDHSRRIQQGLVGRAADEAAGQAGKVAIPGAAHSYSDLALAQLMDGHPSGQPPRLHVDSFAAAMEAVESGAADLALLPIENTVAGSLNEVYRLLKRYPLQIVAEETLVIEHVLAGLPAGRVEDLQQVISHPVALQQCQRFLAGIRGCRTAAASDTASAAESVAAGGDPAVAAVCSEACARRLGLKVLKRDIADTRRNRTRFVLLGARGVPMDPTRSGRTSLTLTVDNRQGSLARCLEAFAHRALNLSKLESRRRPSADGEYLFYLDVDAWAEEPAMAAALTEIRDYTNDFRILGSYPRQDKERRDKPASPPPTLPTVTLGEAPDRPDHPRRRTVHIGRIPVGDAPFVLIAGPCAVENRQQMLAAAAMAKEAGAVVLRGGAFKPRTSPHAFQGLGFPGLDLLVEAGETYDFPVITEVLRSEDAERVAERADCLQVGARNMQNFALLRKLGTLDKPVLLKRGLSASIDELLAAAEHITAGGNRRVIFCERGIRTFETATRSTLDVSAVPVLRERTGLPVIVDPSHAAGRRELVIPLALAAVAAGANGLMVEIHPDPAEALCDGPQALTAADLLDLRGQLDGLLGGLATRR